MTRRPPHLLNTSTCCQATMTCWIGSGGRQGSSSMRRGLRRRVSIPWYVFTVVIFRYIYILLFFYVCFFFLRWGPGPDLAWTWPGPSGPGQCWPRARASKFGWGLARTDPWTVYCRDTMQNYNGLLKLKRYVCSDILVMYSNSNVERWTACQQSKSHAM